MWISKRYQRTIIQAQCRGQKHKRQSRKTNVEPQNKDNEKTEFPGTVWNMLPQGLWLKAEYFSIDQKREVGSFGNGVFQSLQNKIEILILILIITNEHKSIYKNLTNEHSSNQTRRCLPFYH